MTSRELQYLNDRQPCSIQITNMNKLIPLLILAILTFGCTDPGQNKEAAEELKRLQSELDSLRTHIAESQSAETGQLATFLTFQKEDAEAAMNFYISLFENSEILDLQRWGADAPGTEGSIMHATFKLNGSLYMCSDSPPVHEWGFTPAVSNYVECSDQAELERLFAALSEDGFVMMPMDNYGFSTQFGFVEDRFGVSWQLNLQ